MKRALAAILGLCLAGLVPMTAPTASAQSCSDPRAATGCKPGWGLYTGGSRDACKICLGDTYATGCDFRGCMKCPSGSVNSADHSQCVPIDTCAGTIQGYQLPAMDWTTGETGPGWWTLQSAFVNVGNGHAQGGITRNQLRNAMGGSFAHASFTLFGGAPGYDSSLPPGFFTCTYDSPRFQSRGKTLAAQAVVVCRKGQTCIPN